MDSVHGWDTGGSLKTWFMIGLMITASHNKVSNNSIKIADPNGGMLSQDLEPFTDALANAPTPEQFLLLCHILMCMYVFFDFFWFLNFAFLSNSFNSFYFINYGLVLIKEDN